jgi:Glycosyltransferase family 87
MLDGAVTAESLYAPLIVLALVAAYMLRARPTRWKSAWLGVVIGLAALTRSEGVFLLPLLAVPVIWHVRRDWLALALACAAATALVLAPWMIRNAVTLDRFVPLSTNGGLTQVATNCHETYYDSRYIGFVYHACALRSRCGELENEAQQSNCYAKGALRYARHHAARVPLVAAARVGRSWQIYRPADDIRYGELWGRQSAVGWVGFAVFILLLVLALPGARLARREGIPLAPLIAAVGLAIWSTLVAFGFSRYRLAAEPVIVILASFGLVALAGWLFGAIVRTDRPP